MCLTSAADSSTAEGIFTAIDEVFAKNQTPWKNCVILSVDNTSKMIETNNSIPSKSLERNENVFIAGCPCHLPHTAANNPHDAFSEYISLNVEDEEPFLLVSQECQKKGKI